MVFEPRTTAPSKTNKFYLKAGRGGYNRCMEINKKTHSCLANCVAMAHGRWLESQHHTDYKKYDKLCIGNACSYYEKDDGYDRGKTPRLGAIICWSGGKKGDGHVAFVEKIYSNGDILTSNSAYGGRRYFTKKITKKSGYKFSKIYKFQGFIYSPENFTTQFNLTRVLKPGCKGDDVKELQKALKISVDGIFGNDTETAVKKFQKSHGLKVDGIVGKKTAHELGWLYKGK